MIIALQGLNMSLFCNLFYLVILIRNMIINKWVLNVLPAFDNGREILFYDR